MLSFSSKRLCSHKKLKVSGITSAFYKRSQHSAVKSQVAQCKLSRAVIPPVAVDELVWKNLDKWPDRIAVECAETQRKYSYIEIYKKSRALANFLHKIGGLKQGSTVAIILPNVPEYPIILLGIIQAGMIATTVNPEYTAGEISRQLVDSDTRLIFTLNDLWPKADQAIQPLQGKKIPVVIINHQKNKATPQGAILFRDTVDGDHNLSFQVSRSLNDVVVLPYSSGTTGLPKGVELTNRNIVANLSQMSAPEYLYLFGGTDNQDVAPVILPMFHIYGLVMTTLALILHGTKMVTVPKFDPTIFINILEKHRPTLGFVVPPLVLLMANHPKILPHHISRMRSIISGAAPLGATDIERLQEKVKVQINIAQGYGLTETSPIVMGQSKCVPNGIKLGGSGFIVSHTECKIVSLDDGKTVLGPNQPGELMVRGYQVMKGYHNNKKATDEVLDAEGWLRTGDIAYYDEDEHFFITERLKELIKVKGFQVPPAELEEVLRDHPEVEDAAVIGVPHSTCGEVPKAFVVSKKGSRVNADTLQEYMATKVAKYKQLVGGITFVDSIPKNPSGKIMRRQLRNM